MGVDESLHLGLVVKQRREAIAAECGKGLVHGDEDRVLLLAAQQLTSVCRGKDVIEDVERAGTFRDVGEPFAPVVSGAHVEGRRLAGTILGLVRDDGHVDEAIVLSAAIRDAHGALARSLHEYAVHQIAIGGPVVGEGEAGSAEGLEASGGVDLYTVGAIAATGVDFISVGQLTKDVKATDYSMLFADR